MSACSLIQSTRLLILGICFLIRGTCLLIRGTRLLIQGNRFLILSTCRLYAFAFDNQGLACSDLGDKQAAIADLQKAVDLYQKQGNNEEWRQKALNRIKELQQ